MVIHPTIGMLTVGVDGELTQVLTSAPIATLWESTMAMENLSFSSMIFLLTNPISTLMALY